MAQEQLKPYIAAEQNIPEFTALAVGLGIVLALVLAAANAYLGLYAGMTVSASIPAAVLSMGILRGLLRRGNILQNNIVQTIASSGESLAAGVIFTVPALVIVGAWKHFEFWPTTLITVCGGLLGVVFMIPMRRALIVEDKTLTYPEGVACAEVLITGEKGGSGLKKILQGFVIGGALKFLSGGIGLLKGSLEWAVAVGNRPFFFGTDVSPALVGVGYIINIEIALLVFLGGAITWFVAVPLVGFADGATIENVLEGAWLLWKTKVRFLGVGAMLVGGVWSLISVRRGIASGLGSLRSGYKDSRAGTVRRRTDRDMQLGTMGILLAGTVIMLLWLYQHLLQNWSLTILTTVVMFVASFLFVAVSSYIVGLVGSSSNPVSGMTICTVLGTSAFLLALGMTGDSAIIATLGVAGVVCCAACSAGDCSQDLKTGYLVGSTPKKQQVAEVIGAIVPALIMAPTLTLLHNAYGIGTGLKAPQATLFASITKAMFGGGELPLPMVYWGMAIAVVLIVLNENLKKRGSRYRTHVMPVAVGIYLPLTLSVPIFLGGVVRAMVDRARSKRQQKLASEAQDTGVLLSSGLIAGESIMGVLLAMVIALGWQEKIMLTGLSDNLMTWLGAIAMVGLVWYLRKGSLERFDK